MTTKDKVARRKFSLLALATEASQFSSGGVRGVWSRHRRLTKHERLLRLEKSVGERKIELSDDQIRLLERFSLEFRERYIETRQLFYNVLGSAGNL